MAYSNSCDKTVNLVMNEFKTLRSTMYEEAVIFLKFSFVSAYYDWIQRPYCSVPEFLQRVDKPQANKSISVGCRQLFTYPDTAREVISQGFEGWPLSSSERSQLTEDVLSKVWENVDQNCTVDVLFKLHVLENHRHVSDETSSDSHGTCSVCPTYYSLH